MRCRSLSCALTVVAGLAIIMFGRPAAVAEPGLTSLLTPVTGQGIGHLSLSPTARGPDFWAQGEVSIRGGLPSTSYIFQRAVDDTPGDGICEVTDDPFEGWLTLVTLTTSTGGAGAAHFVRHTPPDIRGRQFDVVARLMTSDGTQLLMSRCMTVTVK